jgi:hypothetical protein
MTYSRLQMKTLSALGALAFLLSYHSLPVSAQAAAAPGTQGSSSASAARTYAQFDEQRGTSALAAPATSEHKAPWGDVMISHKTGGCGLPCRAGIAE